MAGYDPNLMNVTTGDEANYNDVRTSGGTPGITQNGIGGFSQGIGQAVTGSNNPFTNASFLPAMATAFKQYHDAGTYRDLGNQAADRADPFGQYRRGYGDQLRDLYADPSKIADTPGYKFALNQALDATQGRLASQGFLGSSQMQQALTAQASGLAQQTWNTEADRLGRFAGAQFDPAHAAQMQMEGGKLAVDSENNALGAMMYPFGPGAGGGTTINNNNGGGGNGSGGSNPYSSSQALQRLQQAGMNPQSAADLMRRLATNPQGISAADMQILQSTGIYDPANGYGGVDDAGGGYDPSGFGGYGSASGDPTLTGINYGGNFDPTNYNDVTGQTGYDPGNYFSSGGPDMNGFQIDPWS
jgi:hypothetical protein